MWECIWEMDGLLRQVANTEKSSSPVLTKNQNIKNVSKSIFCEKVTKLTKSKNVLISEPLKIQNGKKSEYLIGFTSPLHQNAKLTGFISFEIVMVDTDRNVVVKSVDDMLLNTYSIFCNVNKEMLKHEIVTTKEIVEEYQLLEKIKYPLSQCLSKGLSIDMTISKIQNETNIPKERILMLVDKYKIRKLLTVNTDTTKLKIKMEEHAKNLNDLSNFVLAKYAKRY